jgi:hypothetical protein
MPSAAGEALQTLPATVPTFWICTPPTSRAAALRASKSGGRSARITSLQVVVAPIVQPDSLRRMPRSPSMRERSSTGRTIGRPTCAG